MAFSGVENTLFGVNMFPTDYSIQPVELAKAVEARGFDSLFFPEHTHIPASRATPFPGGGDLPKHYWHAHDPFVALGAAAAVTEHIRLGTGICLVIERDPITLAKEIASLDMISNGRAIIGIGAGWNREEMENHGANYQHRWAIVREKVLAMREIWNNDTAEFHGEHVDFAPIWSYPKPVQAGGPPILDRRQLEVGFRPHRRLRRRLAPDRGLGVRQHGAPANSPRSERPQSGRPGSCALRRAAGCRAGGRSHRPRLRPHKLRIAVQHGGRGTASARSVRRRSG